MSIGFPTNITLPTSGQVQWDSTLNQALQTLIDAVEAQVTVDGINIQSSLDLQGNYAINVKGLKFSATTDDGTSRSLFWKSDGELYVRDGSGRSVQLTASGSLNISLNGGIGGDYIGSSAQEVYSSSGAVFTFTSSPGVYATLEAADLKVHYGSTAVYTDVRSSPVLGTTYNLTLPSGAPSVTSPVVMDTTGTLMPARDLSITALTASSVASTSLTASFASFGTSTVTSLTASQGMHFSQSFSRPIDAIAFSPSYNATDVSNGTIPKYSNGGWVWTSQTGPGFTEVSTDLGLEAGTRIQNLKVFFDRVESGRQNDANSFSLGLIKDSHTGSPATVVSVSSTTGSISQTMVLSITGTLLVDVNCSYRAVISPVGTGSIFRGIILSGTRNFG